jgi:peroxiredoxin (alkyl hydroperoxide reductase subunit C)
LDKSITRKYDVLLGSQEAYVATSEEDMDTTVGGDVALRGSFLIDKKGVIRHSVVNDLPLGRNIDEMLRMIDALDHHNAHGEVCPAGWTEGKTAMKPSNDGVKEYLSAEADNL